LQPQRSLALLPLLTWLVVVVWVVVVLLQLHPLLLPQHCE